MTENILTVKNICKAYPGVLAVNNVSIEFEKGEVHALIGENGAGKSTLIKIISGAEYPDNGVIEVYNKEYSQMTPRLSKGLGIEVIYQEFNLMPTLTVAENIYLGNLQKRRTFFDINTLAQKSAEIFREMNVDLDPLELVRNLSVAEMQFVEIARALSNNAQIVVMDEPTDALTNVEIEILFKLIRRLKENGVTIIYISHRLEELFQISDRITVMRDGQKITTLQTKDSNRQELIGYMVGREVKEVFPTRKNKLGQNKIEVKEVWGPGVNGVSFDVRAGEVLGIAGLVGSGRTELANLIFGNSYKAKGEIIIDSKKVKFKSPRDAIKLGIGLIPEDRKQQGVALNLCIKSNISLPILKSISRLMIVDTKKEEKTIENFINILQIKTPSVQKLVKDLSGGNQQKVVLSKWLASESKILIFDEPTRGIDVGAKQEFYKLISKMAEDGLAIIIISSELEEVIGLADKMIVLNKGRLIATLSKQEFDKEKILNYAFGSN